MQLLYGIFIVVPLFTFLKKESPASDWLTKLPHQNEIANARIHNVTGYTSSSLASGFQPRLSSGIFPPCIFDTRDPDYISLLTSIELNRLGQNKPYNVLRNRIFKISGETKML